MEDIHDLLDFAWEVVTTNGWVQLHARLGKKMFLPIFSYSFLFFLQQKKVFSGERRFILKDRINPSSNQDPLWVWLMLRRRNVELCETEVWKQTTLDWISYKRIKKTTESFRVRKKTGYGGRHKSLECSSTLYINDSGSSKKCDVLWIW